jgi:ribosomal protein L31
MKAGIHPNYREVCFQDMSNGFKFVTRSCANTKEMIKMVHRSLWTTWVDALRNSATASEKQQLNKNGLQVFACAVKEKAARNSALLFFRLRL